MLVVVVLLLLLPLFVSNSVQYLFNTCTNIFGCNPSGDVYIINFLSIAIQGEYLVGKIKKSAKKDDLLHKLYNIIPKESLISAKNVIVYQLDELDGSIKKLESINGIPSDKNYLNYSLEESNLLFDSLLEIEQEL